MTSVFGRRDRRYDVEIPVKILSRGGDMQAVTENVSYRGLYLRTNQALPKMQLFRVRLTVPTQAEEIVTNLVTNAIVAHGSTVGLGVAFFGLDGQQRAQWEKFVQSVRDRDGVSDRPADEAAAIAMRRSPELVVAAASVKAFERLSRDIANGTLVVHATSLLDVNSPVSVRVIHPVTQGDFRVSGIVDRHLRGGGLALSLPSMDTGARARLTDFVGSAEDAQERSLDIVDFESISPPRPSASHRPSGLV